MTKRTLRRKARKILEHVMAIHLLKAHIKGMEGCIDATLQGMTKAQVRAVTKEYQKMLA